MMKFTFKSGCQVLLLLLSISIHQGMADNVGEYELKAAFMYKFAQFTEWSNSVVDPFFICVVGNDPFDNTLQMLDGKKINHASIVTQHPTTLENAKNCQVIFLNPSNSQQLKQWQAGLKTLPILTISENPEAWNFDVMIVLSTEPNRISFSINRSAARNVGMDFRAQLLELASILK